MCNSMVKLKNGVFKKSLALFLAVLMFVTGMAGGFNISAFAAAGKHSLR